MSGLTRRGLLCLFIIVAHVVVASAQTGSLKGTISDAESGQPVAMVKVILPSLKRQTLTNRNGAFEIKNIAPGTYAVTVSGVTIVDSTISNVRITSGTATTLDIQAQSRFHSASAVYVYGASKKQEKITETPAAVTTISDVEVQRAARGNQLAKALEGLTGVDIVQNGATDFNVNTRGFNNSTNRRLLVLVDGRDVALQQISATEWNSFATPLSDISRIELVRGPAAALYGANAFNGVLNITTLSPKESQGTTVNLLAGDYKTFRGDARHAGTMGDLSYKITLGHSQSLNLAINRTDSASLVNEYPALWPIAREQNRLSAEDRETFATYGTLRFDYDLNSTQSVIAEFGYSQFGNEVMLAGAGRIHVPQTAKPFARLAFHDTKLHAQATYNARNTIDTMRILAAPPGTIILDESYDVNLDAQYNDSISSQLTYVVGGQYQHMSIGSRGTVFIKDPITADIGGVYGQLEYKPSRSLAFVASARVDEANIFPLQFSPRAAVVVYPAHDQQVRLAFGRSFQRPNFSELFRRYNFRPAFTAQGAPVNFRAVQQRINDTLSALTGQPQNVDLSLFDPTITAPGDIRAIQPIAVGIGNPDLRVEENYGLDLGYKGVIGDRLFVTVDVYYNRLQNFISGFLPGVNPNYRTWSSASVLPGDVSQYSGLVDSIVYNALHPMDRARFTTLDGRPAFVVSNTNIGIVDQYGVEISAEYSLTQYLRVNANYSYYAFDLVDATTPNPFLATGEQLLLPNTSPHRVNLGATYAVPGVFDVAAQFRYVEGFAWLAGDFKGFVPSYALLNVNAGYHVTQELKLGLVVTNLLDRRHYQIFGGSIIPRLTYLSASYTF